MKQLTVIFTIFTALLLATSCSKEELPGGDSTDEPGLMQTYTFTVSPDLTMEGDAKTRSTGTQEEMPTRCFMQIVGNTQVETGVSNGNGGFTFSVQLPSNTTFMFLFWADNNNSDVTPTDLSAIKYTPGTVAFAANETDTPENVINNGVSLKHIVTKITLQHNGTNKFSPKADDVITATLPCATTYDIAEGTISGSETHKFTHTFSGNTSTTGTTNLCSFYVLAPSNANNSIDITFRDYGLTIDNVSMSADTHITLSGDFSSQNEKWEPSDAVRAEAFQSCFYNDNGTPKGEESFGAYVFYTDQTTVQRFFDEILVIDKGTYYGISLFGHTINCYDHGDYMDFSVDDTTFMIYYGDRYQLMPPTFNVPTFEKDW